jgi:hypothetical protein
MEKLVDKVDIPKVDVLFAPNHGRASGKVPTEWLERMDPKMVVLGEAPSEHLDYYSGYDTITQNWCGDILLDCRTGKVHVYVSDNAYHVDYLYDDGLDHSHGLYYLGTLLVLERSARRRRQLADSLLGAIDPTARRHNTVGDPSHHWACERSASSSITSGSSVLAAACFRFAAPRRATKPGGRHLTMPSITRRTVGTSSRLTNE